jgi:hypothetical protein
MLSVFVSRSNWTSSIGQAADVDIHRVVPVGATVLEIIESDLTGDDAIGTIDLTQDMDVEVTRNVQGDYANYDITLTVSSTSGVAESGDDAPEDEG